MTSTAGTIHSPSVSQFVLIEAIRSHEGRIRALMARIGDPIPNAAEVCDFLQREEGLEISVHLFREIWAEMNLA